MGVDLGDWLSFCPTYNQHIGTLTNCKYRFIYKIPVGFHMWFYKSSQVVEPSQRRTYVNSQIQERNLVLSRLSLVKSQRRVCCGGQSCITLNILD